MSGFNDKPEMSLFLTGARDAITRVESLLHGSEHLAPDWPLAFRLIHSMTAASRSVNCPHFASIARCVELLLRRAEVPLLDDEPAVEQLERTDGVPASTKLKIVQPD